MERASLVTGLVLAAGALAAPGCRPECGEPGTVCTVVGTGEIGLDLGEGTPARDAAFYYPADVAFGPDGDAYITDWNNHRVRRWDVVADTVTTVAGLSNGLPGDGPPGPATLSGLNHPTSVSFDDRGNLLIAGWHTRSVKHVDLATGILQNICGTGVAGFGGDEGPAEVALLDLPVNVVVDSNGVLFIADQNNNRIRWVDSSGIIHTYAGTGLGTGFPPGSPALCVGADPAGTTDCFNDGPIDPTAPDAALLNNLLTQSAPPAGRIAIDADDDLYVADTANHAIRKIDRTTATMTTIAGLGPTEPGFSGDGGPASAARLFKPSDLEVAPDGTIYVADTGNHCIRAIAPDGVISTVAGVCGTSGAAKDGVPAGEALFDVPYGLTLGPDGNLYVADAHNSVVRVVYLAE